MKKFKRISADQSIRKKIKNFFLACRDRFSNFSIAEVFDRANAQNVLNFLQEYVLLHEKPRTIRLDQAQWQIGQQIKAFFNQNNIQLIGAPIHDHRAIGLVERLIQKIRNRLAWIKTVAQIWFNLRASKNLIIYQIRIYRQKTIDLSVFEARFEKKAKTHRIVSTEPDLNTLSYKPILNK